MTDYCRSETVWIQREFEGECHSCGLKMEYKGEKEFVTEYGDYGEEVQTILKRVYYCPKCDVTKYYRPEKELLELLEHIVETEDDGNDGVNDP